MRRVLLMVSLALWAAVTARAQPSVELQLNSRQAYAGEAFVVAVEVTDFQEAEAPVWPALEGATVRQLGAASESSFISIVGNRRTETHSRTWQFEVTPSRVGPLVIPPITVRADGKAIQTQPLTLEVKPSDRERYFAAEVTVDPERIYVGQRVRAKLTIWVKPPVFNGRRVHPNAIWTRIVNASDFGPFPAEVRNPDNVLRERGVDDGRAQWYAFDLSTEAIVERAGLLSLGSISIGIEYPTMTGSRSFRVQPTFPPIEVRPVPMEGRPPDYAGAVGLYAIDTRATPTRVRVGDPIELTIEVSGEGPLSSLAPPLLASNAALNDGFRLPGEPLAGEVVNGRRRFVLVIRAIRDDVTEIPAIEYPYFDPQAERFVIARSKPIPLKVEPVAQIEGVDVSRLGAGRAQRSSEGVESLDGLRDIETRESLLLATTPNVAAPVLQGLLVGPPVAFAGLWAATALVRRRIGDTAARRRSGAGRAARTAIRAARARPPRDAAVAIAAALSQYLADRRAEPPASWIGTAVEPRLASLGVRESTARRVGALLSLCESASFAAVVDQSTDQLVAEALACLALLEHERL